MVTINALFKIEQVYAYAECGPIFWVTPTFITGYELQTSVFNELLQITVFPQRKNCCNDLVKVLL
jgi:hypothetical protein